MNGPIIKENENIISIHFDSIIDFMEHQGSGKNKEMFDEDTRRSRSERPDWIGSTNKNVGDVIDHALSGDQKLYSSLEKKVKTLEALDGLNNVDHIQKVKAVRRVLKYSNQGDEIDIHKVYSGKLETAWSKRVRVVQDFVHPLVTLHIDIGGASSVTSAQSITVKEYNESLSVERLAAMTHIGFYRVFGFAAKAAQDIRRLKSNYGYSAKTGDHNVAINLQEELAEGHSKFIYIGRSVSASDAQKDLKKVYQQLTGEK